MAKKKRNRPKGKEPAKSASKPAAPSVEADEDAKSGKSANANVDEAKRNLAEAKRLAKLAKRKGTNLPNARAVAGSRVAEPTFWFGFEVSWTKLAVTRVVFFTLLALDALLQISHAPRYGAGDFNVGHFGWLDSIGPGRVGYSVGQLLCAYLFTLVAFGVATRAVLPIATAIYAWLYFGSQLDSYQHHYLVVMVLAIGCFVPWERPADPEVPVRTWAVRLILVQLGIMYLWAAISKLDPAWVSGAALDSQLVGTMKALVGKTVGIEVTAVMVIVVEVVLALTVWIKRAWFFAAPLGLLFHIGILVGGFEIGLFAYLMVAIYALVVPDRVWMALARPFADLGTHVREVAERPGFLAILAGILVAIGVAWLVRFQHVLALAFVLAIVPVAIAARRRVAVVGIAHAAAIVMWLLVDRGTSVAEDYYRYWGGSQRRLGDLEAAETAYRKLVEIAPDKEVGHFQLARILLGSNRAEEGLEELRAAQRVAPRIGRSFAEEARWLARSGRRAEAIAKAKEAVAADASDADARKLLENLEKAQPAPPPKTDPE